MPYVTVNGLRLHYLAEGFGPAVLLLHGLGSCGEDWLLLQAPALRWRYRVLMPDLRGHGRSDVPSGPYTVPQLADDVAGFLEATGTHSAHVVGLSLGGAVAQALAVRHPERVRSLVLVNTFARLRPRGWAEWRRTIIRFLVPLVNPARYARMEAKELFPRPDQQGLRRVAMQRLCSTNPRGFRAALLAAARYDGRRDLARIRVPTLIVAGLQDTVVPLRAKEELAARIPGARLVTVPRSGHATPTDQPVLFNRLLLQFLESVEGVEHGVPETSGSARHVSAVCERAR
ncbi:MAG: alpha/beta fold hydrolase [Anaerolineae bacterium]|nr:alpha/beta hydrolase [Anaerolineae bacterium]MDW7992751.1 alpha/beta fold hydrolase [Anaerolineae bacterium]